VTLLWVGLVAWLTVTRSCVNHDSGAKCERRQPDPFIDRLLPRLSFLFWQKAENLERLQLDDRDLFLIKLVGYSKS
jgi:hypothetical protein